MKQYNQRA